MGIIYVWHEKELSLSLSGDAGDEVHGVLLTHDHENEIRHPFKIPL